MTPDAAEAAGASDWMSGFHQMSGWQQAGEAGGGNIRIGETQTAAVQTTVAKRSLKYRIFDNKVKVCPVWMGTGRRLSHVSD